MERGSDPGYVSRTRIVERESVKRYKELRDTRQKEKFVSGKELLQREGIRCSR
jgi:hypothetical protein